MQEEKDMKKDNDEIVDEAGLNVSGHILIRDKESGEELVNKRNAIHYGNMARVVALALKNADNEYINFIAYGSGGSTVDTSGKVIYKNPRVSESYDASGSLYNRTFQKSFTTQDDSNKIEVIQGASYSDLKITEELFAEYRNSYYHAYERTKKERRERVSVLDDIDFEIEYKNSLIKNHILYQ